MAGFIPDQQSLTYRRILGLFIWIEIVWLALWVCKLVAQAVPIVFQFACGLISTGIRKYSLVLKALEIPLSLLLWSIVAYATTSVICIFDHGKCDRNWLTILEQVFKAGIIVAAIFLIEKTIMQLISINYHHKQYDQKIRESKKLIRLLDVMYDASRALFPEVRHFIDTTMPKLIYRSSAKTSNQKTPRFRVGSWQAHFKCNKASGSEFSKTCIE